MKKLLLSMSLITGAATLACGDSEAPPVPTAIEVVTQPPASAEAGSTISTVTVVIKDDKGRPMAGQAISVVANNGSVTGTPERTSSGPTTIGAWTLGPTVGTNSVVVYSGNLPSVTIAVQVVAGPPASLEVIQGSGQVAYAGTAVSSPVVVRVSDRFGNPTPAQQVAFNVNSGGGVLAGSVTTTNESGYATAPPWTLGKRNVPQQMQIAVGGLVRQIDARIFTTYKIDVRFFGSISEEHKRVFLAAAERLTAIITGGGAPIQANGFSVAYSCGLYGIPALWETVDGIIIYASIDAIDGPGGTLAQAGPCGFRGASSRYLPAVATMEFDIADLATLTAGGSLEEVTTHEMMHTLGFGTLWPTNAIIFGKGGSDPRYTGTAGVAACRNAGGAVTCAYSIPVENIGGTGTAGSHWRESVFSNEMMTGYLNTGGNPFSAMSVASMSDLGYQINMAAADPFVVLSGLRASPARAQAGGTPDWERVITGPADPSLMEKDGGLLRPAGGVR